MQVTSNFQVYNASAGSGKTFTLVKEYLKILLTSSDVFVFQNILAITFTNKAASEMKQRVLSNLQNFSEGKETDLSLAIFHELDIEKDVFQKRSQLILESILRNYSAFSITTIDSFTHKIIRSFAYDLGLSQNFEVEMDNQELLREAIDVLISKIGVDSEITSLLVDYSLEKSEEDKSWDISYDMLSLAKVLFSETEIPHFKKLSKTSIQEFVEVKKKLLKKKSEVEKSLKEIGAKGLDLIDDTGLEYKNFYRSMLPNHFKNLEIDLNNAKFFESNTLREKIENGEFYTKSASENVKTTIDGISHLLTDLYFESEKLYKQYIFVAEALKKIVPLAVLNNISQELTSIKEDNNIQLNSEFNKMISNEIQNQPAPFIYERIGQKFQHYFIDEMQDTSVLQWQNIIPLIENSLSQENTGLLLVGDGKQSIYRWRGSKPEQFIELSEKNAGANPFYVPKEVKNLDRNYRSFSEIINFNNSFFKHASGFLKNDHYKLLYSETSHQNVNSKEGGFVNISLLEKEQDKEEDELKYAKKVHEIIQNLDSHFTLSDVSVLVRGKKEGIAIANYLSEQNIEIVSSETLLLTNSSKVIFLANFLQWTINPTDEHLYFELIHFIYDHLQIKITKHDFIKECVSLNATEFFIKLEKHDVYFDLNQFQSLSLFEKVENLVRSFKLMDTSDAYVQFFLDEVLARQSRNDSLNDFLDYWNVKKSKLSISSGENSNAINVMTIHKSKGLEFPVVILPCDLNMEYEIKPDFWLPNSDEILHPLEEILLPLTKETQHINKESKEYYDFNKEQLQLDNYNLLYVALTRAVEQLYVVTEKRLPKGSENLNYYSGLFINFLKESGLWDENQTDYSFGNAIRVSKIEEQEMHADYVSYINNPWQECNLTLLASSSKLWDTDQGEAINYGNQIHELLSQIITAKDIDNVIQSNLNDGFIEESNQATIKSKLEEIVNHEELQPYFADGVVAFNEREIVDVDNQIVIPDRLVYLSSNEVVIIDYKTGKESVEHQQQLLKYERVLKSMNLRVQKKLLIYIKEGIRVAEI